MTDERRGLLVDAGRSVMKAYFERAAQAEAEVSFGVGPSEDELKAAKTADNLAMKMLK
jgi:pyridoxine 5'-phosphate synthase PdxJ